MQVLLATICFVAGVVCTGIVRVLPGFLPDVPNERSSHHHVVPRGGGLGFALPSLVAGLVLFITAGTPMQSSSLALLGGGLALLGLGLLDDGLRLAVLPRLAAQACVAFAACAWGLPDRIAFTETFVLHGPAATGLQVLTVVTALNFFNFMDGIDALAAVQAIFASLSLAVFSAEGHHFAGSGLPPESAFLLALAGAVVGFLLWNLPPAAIFMGDGGSYFLGFVLSYPALLIVGSDTQRVAETLTVDGSAWVNPAIVAAASVWFVFFLDPLATLLLRIAHRENPFRAHRDHLYQLLYHGGWSSGAVISLLLAADAILVGTALLCGMVGGAVVWALPLAAMALVTGAYVLLRRGTVPDGAVAPTA